MKTKTNIAVSLFFLCLLLVCQSIQITASQPTPIQTDYEGMQQVIRDQLEGINAKDILIIKGSNLSVQEELLMAIARLQLSKINQIQAMMDTGIDDISATSLDYEKLIFLGGDQSNNLIASLEKDDNLDYSAVYAFTSFHISIATMTTTGTEVLVFSSILEETLLQNKAPERSFLSPIMDKRIIPIVATITSISLLQLVNIFGQTISEFFFDFTSEKLGSRKKEKHRRKKKQQTRSKRIIKEFLSILIATVIFALALSWTWSSDLTTIWSLFLINLVVIGLFYLIRESLRIYYSKKYQLHTEHVFWPLGSILTIGSTVLGNTFSLASYTYLENEEKEKRYAHMYHTIFKILFLITICSFLLNIFIPMIPLQMFYVFTIMSLFIDMTPIKPLDGYDVKRWNKRKWLLLYIFVFLSYFIIMFSTFL